MSLHEQKRISFLENRDGIEGALEFAKRTVMLYRKSVLKRGGNNREFHHASIKEYRRSYIESYVFLKTYILEKTAIKQ
jgi:CMP-2-keto-3-deoxyoctulosonic acid synthetase